VTDRWASAFGDLDDVTERLQAHAVALGARDCDLAVKTLGAMMGAYLTQIWGEPDHPAFLPSVGYHQMYGTPSPDTIYRSAQIDGSASYLIAGHRGTVPDVTVMAMGAPTPAGLRTFPAWDLDDLELAADQSFEVILAAQRPAASGNWWQLDPEMRTLMLRSVSAVWGAHDEPRVAITRLDAAARRERFAAPTVERKLRAYAAVVEGMVMSGLNKAARLRAAGVNQLATVDYSSGGGIAGQWYQEGWFDLTDTTALICEVRLSADVQAFSLSLTDSLFSTIDWATAHSSLNHTQAEADEDGALRWVIAASDPSVRNWLDTTGHLEGALQFRWTGGAQAPTVGLRAVPLASIRDELPQAATVSAAERDRLVRARQRGCQLRAKW
jgi:hypothetical protein